jgi:hypothetical protein
VGREVRWLADFGMFNPVIVTSTLCAAPSGLSVLINIRTFVQRRAPPLMLVMSALLCLIYSIAMPDGGSRMRIIASVLACGQCARRGIVSGSVCVHAQNGSIQV